MTVAPLAFLHGLPRKAKVPTGWAAVMAGLIWLAITAHPVALLGLRLLDQLHDGGERVVGAGGGGLDLEHAGGVD